MPYYIYRITSSENDNQAPALEQLHIYEKYREAKLKVRELWAQEEKDSGSIVRMIHAETPGEAEKLLSAPRDNRIIGDD
jgi:hypothetical protein